MKEIWKDACGFEESYQVSNLGRVRSKNRIIRFCRNSKKETRFQKGKLMKTRLDKDGYVIVSLQTTNGKSKTIRVHRLVLNTFSNNKNKLPCVNNKDENKENNCLSNLEYCTHKYNSNYGTCIKRKSEHKKIPIIQYDKEMNFIKEWDSATDASVKLGMDNSSISACVRGKLKSFHGYIWQKK